MALLGRLLTANHARVFGVRSLAKDTLLLRPFKLIAEKYINFGSFSQEVRSAGSATMRLKHHVNTRMAVNEMLGAEGVLAPYGHETMVETLGHGVEQLLESHPVKNHHLRAAVYNVANAAEFKAPVSGMGFFTDREKIHATVDAVVRSNGL